VAVIGEEAGFRMTVEPLGARLYALRCHVDPDEGVTVG